MLGKNNKFHEKRFDRKVTRYAIRRLSVGVASVAVSGLLFLSPGGSVLAQTTSEESSPAQTNGAEGEENVPNHSLVEIEAGEAAIESAEASIEPAEANQEALISNQGENNDLESQEVVNLREEQESSDNNAVETESSNIESGTLAPSSGIQTRSITHDDVQADSNLESPESTSIERQARVASTEPKAKQVAVDSVRGWDGIHSIDIRRETSLDPLREYGTDLLEVVGDNVIIVNHENQNEYFHKTERAVEVVPEDGGKPYLRLTENRGNQKGSLSTQIPININHSFTMEGRVIIGDKYTPEKRLDDQDFPNTGSNVGADGISFFLSRSKKIGSTGSAMGLGGLRNSFGFKLDTYHNTQSGTHEGVRYGGRAVTNSLRDPYEKDILQSPNGEYGSGPGHPGGVFGAFVYTQSSGDRAIDPRGTSVSAGTDAVTYNDPSAPDASRARFINNMPSPENQDFKAFKMKYDADAKNLTFIYDGITWEKDVTDWV